ncbi:MAG: sulfatase-like hydrolase/transferase [Lachnospiraceae bacterium]|nr:sulfatase-like hydrolase/transferase [Lachnospiraceae bacterium]
MSNQKNVLMICTDHWSGSLLGCAGRTDIMTPTLDYLANNGVWFENFYSECPVCIPARRTMMTGLSPRSHGDRVYSDHMRMPEVPTLAQTFHEQGYQTMAVGKLHVYPQRDRIGFDDVILAEEGRYELGTVDDYQIWLGEQGFIGQEFLHSMGNNTYYTRPWHLPDRTHPTNWVTMEMMKQIKRKDPTKPFFYYCSYQFPHPPLVPLQTYLDMYSEEEIKPPTDQDWLDDSHIFKAMCAQASIYSKKEQRRARRAFFAQCTHIDYQIRLLVGTLRECGLLDDTILVFTSDHGDMLFDHGMVAKRCFYEEAACVPFILSGKPMQPWKGRVETKLAGMGDLMPTLLNLCGLSIPSTVEGIPLMTEQTHEYLYGEISEGEKATRMIRWQNYKLIYYPCGNVLQLFDLEKDPKETHNFAADAGYEAILKKMVQQMISCLHDGDLEWIRDGKLIGFDGGDYVEKADYGMYNQRGYHWPTPGGYSNQGKNA